jgi:hypothetical protein
VPLPNWVKRRIDEWTSASGINSGRLFRSVNKSGVVWGTGVTQKVVRHTVRNFARTIGIEKLARTIYGEPAPGSATFRAES